MEIYPKQEKDLPPRAGLIAGLDLRFGTAHVALVPSFRVQAARTGNATDSEYPGGGFPVWTIRPGLALRFEF